MTMLSGTNSPTSPYIRSVHPGAVLLSPQSSAINNSNGNAVGPAVAGVPGGVVGTRSPTMGVHSMSLNDILDQSQFHLDSSQPSTVSLQSNFEQHMPLHQPLPRGDRHHLARVASPLQLSATSTASGTSGTSVYSQIARHMPTASTADADGTPAEEIQRMALWIRQMSPGVQLKAMDAITDNLHPEVLATVQMKMHGEPAPIPSAPRQEQTRNLDSLVSGGPAAKAMERAQWSPELHARPQPPQHQHQHSLSERRFQWSPEPVQNNSGRHTHTADHRPQWSPEPQTRYSHQPIFSYTTQGNSGNNLAATLTASPQAQPPRRPNSAGPNLSNNQTKLQSSPPPTVRPYVTSLQQDRATADAVTEAPVAVPAPVPAAAPAVLAASPMTTHLSPTDLGSLVGPGNNQSMLPENLTDPKLLTNIPAWLKTLRLHKYSDILAGVPWEELVYLDDTALEKKGVAALGARRKLLKAFNVVREYKERGLIDNSAFAQNETLS
ncbi:Vts1p KNAG_0E00260 [Huiozyma naganishii CBS 8797]|uniref:RNA-binding protein VTS1 n=1 Tax=Huiozyma naganishii (strain ATCC MYA-139 / BCRC 22969 / CBS 8797 / KCTC 17520 / NBRC 10181 / NCYC 3082 / Yp74L-3) TaxID=1071383 RepID=J7S6B2_HUIN7|nr:hypothetical protein KNAG_0E00260 [Kazachstania naganishii CBS 8797]CCK70294.1 hypothetical protein KNAG_0E00260 [Kazachstania naganishii CBS 8797]